MEAPASAATDRVMSAADDEFLKKKDALKVNGLKRALLPGYSYYQPDAVMTDSYTYMLDDRRS
jgi:hypothetical protein